MLVNFQCVLVFSVDIWAKNILYRFIKGQPHFNMPRDAKNEFGPQQTKRLLFIQIQTLLLNMHHTRGNYLLIQYATNWNKPKNKKTKQNKTNNGNL